MRKQLRFRPDGTFTIVQFTDTEFSDPRAADEIKMNETMARILAAEQPDLVVYTGDVIASGGNSDPIGSFRCAAAVPESRGIPWAAVFGNHDAEAPNVTREQLHALQLTYRCNYAKPDPPGLHGAGNFVLTVAGEEREPAAALYFLDSGSYSPLEHSRLGFYDWIRRSQIQWYTEQSHALTTDNGGSPLPSLMFFHIPLPEYHDIWDFSVCHGVKGDPICAPWINTGLFAAMMEMGDVRGVFAGHDHANDFIGTLHGIKLAYGRTTRNAYAAEPFPTGARVIRLTAGTADFETWLHLEDGTVVTEQPVHQPEGRQPFQIRSR
ncbi:metallophosphoesterase family protein [Paenibacillus methanolicus]|uniref:Calcineurin-like phosphoesterase family protein n=1 Tax=Paenibacillus methanolicus TaxID=582686 RepID=A0A5S5CN59_9BACL|nr:metallophosphoesterase family protein [Paenibacillus methanolicus]TYP79798.1 calcineurin-like phosphoesterase family protein [Paenibacillus methanolicus]